MANNNLYYHIKLTLGDSEYRLAIQERPHNSSNSMWFVEARQQHDRVDVKVKSFVISDADSALLRSKIDLNRFIVTVGVILDMESWDVRMI